MKFILLNVFLVTILVHLNHGYRILGIFPCNVPSHHVMFQELMKNLAKRGHQVDVISEIPLEKPFPNYTDIFFDSQLRKLGNNFTLATVRTYVASLVDVIALVNGNELCERMGDPVIQNLIQNPPSDPPYDLLITEVFGGHCYMAIGHMLKIPVIAISSADLYPWLHQLIAAPQNLAWYPNNAIKSDLRDMNFWSRLYNTVHNTYNVLRFNYLTSVQDETIRKHLGPHAPPYNEVVSDVGLILVNSHSSINGIRTTVPALIEVGGLHINDDAPELPKDMKKWLDESEGFVYFSLGSMVKIESLPTETLKAFYETFIEISPVRVLMKVVESGELPKGLPSNVMISKWLPQAAVLKHPKIKAVITHGGLFTMQEVIYYGIPILGMPLFADQIRNIHVAAKNNYAIFLDIDNITKEKFATALKKILYDPIYRNSARKVSALFRDRPQTPIETACYWVEYIIRHGSKALRSPAMDLKWWEVELLDIYIFLLLSLLLILYLLYRILRAIINSFSKSKKPKRSKKRN